MLFQFDQNLRLNAAGRLVPKVVAADVRDEKCPDPPVCKTATKMLPSHTGAGGTNRRSTHDVA